MKKAFITGVNGQDGSYLAELLLSKGYEVHGLVRVHNVKTDDPDQPLKNVRENHLENAKGVKLHYGDISDHAKIQSILEKIQPDEVYHFAAFAFVRSGFSNESSIIEININSTLALLSYFRQYLPKCRFFFAGSSEMFGETDEFPQNENTKFNPRSIYGISKVASYQIVKNYRSQYGMFCCTGINYNHESVRRGFSYVTRKISRGVAKIHLGLEEFIELGNIDSQRDWGYSPDYVKAFWMMLQAEQPRDYVISTGQSRTIRDLLQVAFGTVGLRYENHIRKNDEYFHPTEAVPLIGDSSKIQKELGWRPEKNFKEMIEEMVRNDIELVKRERDLVSAVQGA